MIVYMIRSRGAAYKFGCTRNTPRRLDALQSASPYRLSLIGERVYRSRKKAWGVEQAIFRRFIHRRTWGEWFRLSPDEAAWAQDLLDGLHSIHPIAKCALRGNARRDKKPPQRTWRNALRSLDKSEQVIGANKHVVHATNLEGIAP